MKDEEQKDLGFWWEKILTCTSCNEETQRMIEHCEGFFKAYVIIFVMVTGIFLAIASLFNPFFCTYQMFSAK